MASILDDRAGKPQDVQENAQVTEGNIIKSAQGNEARLLKIISRVSGELQSVLTWSFRMGVNTGLVPAPRVSNYA